jgi:hypothetical protein
MMALLVGISLTLSITTIAAVWIGYYTVYAALKEAIRVLETFEEDYDGTNGD